MGEIIDPQDFDRLLTEVEMHGLDPVQMFDTSGHQVSWRDDPETPAPFVKDHRPYRDIEPRDEAILALPEEYDCIQIVLSRVVGANGGWERQTYKTAHLSLEAVKQHLRRTRETDKQM